MNLSLNAGAELDDEVSSVEEEASTLVTDPLNLEENVTEATSLESKVLDLIDLHSDITKAKGMTQAFAMEAIRIEPSFSTVPVGYYTKLPTATRFKESLEGLIDSIKDIIDRAVKALLELIAKIYNWITGGGKDKKREETIETGKETTEKAKEAVGKINKLFINKNFSFKTHEGKVVICRNMDDFIDNFVVTGEYSSERLVKFLRKPEAIVSDIATSGDYTKLVMQVVREASTISKKLLGRTGAIWRAMSEEILHGKPMSAESVAQMETPIKVNIGGAASDVSEIVAKINVQKQLMNNETEHKPIDFGRLYDNLASSFTAIYVSAVSDVFKEVSGNLEKTKNNISKLQVLLNKEAEDSAGGLSAKHLFNDLIRSANKDIVDVGRILNIIDEWIRTVTYVAASATSVAGILVKKIIEAATNSVNADEKDAVIDDWRKILDRLTECATKIKVPLY